MLFSTVARFKHSITREGECVFLLKEPLRQFKYAKSAVCSTGSRLLCVSLLVDAELTIILGIGQLLIELAERVME